MAYDKGDGYINIISTLGQKDNADFYIALAEDVQFRTEDDFDSDSDYNTWLERYRKGSVQEALMNLNDNVSELSDTIDTNVSNLSTAIDTKLSEFSGKFLVTTETITADTWTSSNIYTYTLKTDSDNVLLLVMPTPGCTSAIYNAIKYANFKIGLLDGEATLVTRSAPPTIDITIDFIEIPLEEGS